MSLRDRRRALMMAKKTHENGFVSGRHVNDQYSGSWIDVTNKNRLSEHNAYNKGNIYVPLKHTISIAPTDNYSIKFTNGEPLSGSNSNCFFGLSLNQTQTGTVVSNGNDVTPVRDVLYTRAGPASGTWEFKYFFIRNRQSNISADTQFNVSVYVNGRQVI